MKTSNLAVRMDVAEVNTEAAIENRIARDVIAPERRAEVANEELGLPARPVRRRSRRVSIRVHDQGFSPFRVR